MKDEFLAIYNALIVRPGADELLSYLEVSGFFEDPASAKHHLNKQGGLCEHSLNVYRRLKWLCDMEEIQNPKFLRPSDESIAIVGLLHDLCKAGTYKKEPKNQKTYDPEKVSAAQKYQIKHDSNGDFIWETVMGYSNDDPFPYGHGEKSVHIIRGFMQLSREEAFAIRFHMGSWNDGEKQNAGKVFEMYELALLTHMADEFATFVDEKGE